MKKILSLLLVFLLLLSASGLPGYADLSDAEKPAPQPLQDNLVVTEHETIIQGQRVPYTATTGTMALSTALGQYEIFFTAYTRSDVDEEAFGQLRQDAEAWFGKE